MSYKIGLLLFGVALALFSGCGGPEGESVFVPSRPDVPAIVFDATEHDFGTVPAGSENTCTFAFINDGGRDLIIENIHASCGCAASKIEDPVIKPGRASEIAVTFHAGYSGKNKKKIEVFTNDPDNRPDGAGSRVGHFGRGGRVGRMGLGEFENLRFQISEGGGGFNPVGVDVF